MKPLLDIALAIMSWFRADITEVAGDFASKVVIKTKDSIRITIEREPVLNITDVPLITNGYWYWNGWPRAYTNWIITNGILVPLTTNTVEYIPSRPDFDKPDNQPPIRIDLFKLPESVGMTPEILPRKFHLNLTVQDDWRFCHDWTNVWVEKVK